MLPDQNYINCNRSITCVERANMVDWMVHFCHNFDFPVESVFAAVNFLDRYLSRNVKCQNIDLVAACALSLAIKIEDEGPFLMEGYVEHYGFEVTVQEMYDGEVMVLQGLEHNLGWPGPISFLQRINLVDGSDEQLRNLTLYFLAVMLVDHCFIGTPPSLATAAAYCFANIISWETHFWVCFPHCP